MTPWGSTTAPTTTVENVFFDFYAWLCKHPTEAVLISNYERGTGTHDNAKLQQHIYDIMGSNLTSRYWVQTSDSPPPRTIAIQRAESVAENSPNTMLVYNSTTNQIVYIEDYHEIGIRSGYAENIQWKLNATAAHIEEATVRNPDQFYISSPTQSMTWTPPTVGNLRSIFSWYLIRHIYVYHGAWKWNGHAGS
ncbi:PLC-like phosphodiesterase [Mycena venus]|uniref:PLC-like phosphodiesterase n=1 Tax=Mycena venus TaxID=2733690 RepID=A0A8H6XH04_9AGAR|nr:PLC-like phosphodiesterase [Mycena venus]